MLKKRRCFTLQHYAEITLQRPDLSAPSEFPASTLMKDSPLRASNVSLFILFGPGFVHRRLWQLPEHASFERGVLVIVITFSAYAIVPLNGCLL
jgi:hypothetical protein